MVANDVAVFVLLAQGGEEFHHTHELSLGAMDQAGAEDGPVQPALANNLFGEPFALVVFASRIGAGTDCGHMGIAHDAHIGADLDQIAGGLDMNTAEGLSLRGFFHDNPDQVNNRLTSFSSPLESGEIE